MDIALKQRLVGAAVLVALGVIFIPMLLDGPGTSGVDHRVPDPPDRRFESRLLPVDPNPTQAEEGGVEPAAPAPAAPVEQPVPRPVVTPRPLPTPDTSPSAEGEVESPPPARPAPAPETRPAFPAASSGNWVLQLGSFGNAANAARLVARVIGEGYDAYQDRVAVGDQTLYRVRVGYWPNQAEAAAAGEALGALLGDLDISVRQVERSAAASAAPPPLRGWMVQVGSFSSEDNALALRERLRAAGFAALMEAVEGGSAISYRVRVGPEIERADAEGVRDRLRAELGLNGIVVSHP